VSAVEASGPRMPPWRSIGRAALLLLALGATVAMVHLVGAPGVGDTLWLALPWIPLVLTVEGARIAIEASATRAPLGGGAQGIPRAELARMHLVGYALTTTMPAGRAVAEAYKAAALAPFTSRARAASVAVNNQALALVANGVVAVPCAIAAYLRTGTSFLTVAVATHAVLVVAGGLALHVGSRSARLLALTSRVSTRLAAPLRRYRDACAAHDVLPVRALALHVAARGLQAVGLGILLGAVASRPRPDDALLAQAVSLVGTTAGDWVPLQLGATDAGWILAAPLLGITAAHGIAVALLAHAVQIAWSVVGAGLPALWRPEGRPVVPEEEPC
jgi:hypothetical protein